MVAQVDCVANPGTHQLMTTQSSETELLLTVGAMPRGAHGTRDLAHLNGKNPELLRRPLMALSSSAFATCFVPTSGLARGRTGSKLDVRIERC